MQSDSNRWLLVALVVALVAIAFYANQTHQQVVRLEQELGTIWANAFSHNVLSGIATIHGDLEEWSKAETIPVRDLRYMRNRIGSMQAVLNNNINDYRQAYPSTSVEVPRHFAHDYLDEFSNDFWRVAKDVLYAEDEDAVWQPTAEDRRVLAEYAADFAELEDMVREYFVGWNNGFPDELGDLYFGRAFIENDTIWIEFVKALEDWALEARYGPNK